MNMNDKAAFVAKVMATHSSAGRDPRKAHYLHAHARRARAAADLLASQPVVPAKAKRKPRVKKAEAA